MVSFGVNCGESATDCPVHRVSLGLAESPALLRFFRVPLCRILMTLSFPRLSLLSSTPPEFAMDSLQTSTTHNWEQPHSIDEQEEEPVEEQERPRKKRRKYIARAWYVPCSK